MKKSKYFAHPTTNVEKTARIGKGTAIWRFSHISKRAKIGENCKIGQNVFVGEGVVIGNNVKIQNNVSVYSGVTLEDDVFCGPSMVFTNVINPRSGYPRNTPEHFRKTTVRQGASIGANATVVCGVTLGRYAFVGAGSVVTKDVSDYALVYGNPARHRGWMCECGEKLNILRPRNKAKLRCKSCRKTYSRKGSKIVGI